MKRVCLALSIVLAAVLLLLFAVVGTGAAPSSEPIPGARPTATAVSPLPEPNQEPVAPESPEIPPLPDLVVESIRVIPATPILGEPAIIQVVIHNQSLYDIADPTNNFWTDVYVDPGVVPIQLGQEGVDAWQCQATWVPAGGRHTLQTEYTFDDVRTFTLWAQVDTDGHVAEANENNNVTGPVSVQVRSRHMLVHETLQDFQLGLASTLDGSHSEGVLRPGLFVEPWQEPPAVPLENSIYQPDFKVDDAPDPVGEPTTWNQIKPAIDSHGQQVFAVWEDGRNGGVFNRDIYFSRSLNGGETWSRPTVRVNWDDPISHDADQISPDITYDPTHGTGNGRLYAVWQDEREHPELESFDIFFAYSDDLGATWSPGVKLNDDVGVATQLNPAVTVGKSEFLNETVNHVYVVWQDRRNGNDDIYLARSDDGGATWSSNYFVTDDPDMTLQNQAAPAVSVENYWGRVYVGWEDWRDPEQPEIYVMWSKDLGRTFGVDVPVTYVPYGQPRTTYRQAPDLVAHTTVELEWYDDPLLGPRLITTTIAVVHVAWQEGLQEESDIYYSYAVYDPQLPESGPVPYEWCFEEPQLVNGYELPSDYVRPPSGSLSWPLEPSWQGQVSLDLIPDNTVVTPCLLASSEIYSKGVMIAWSDARSYDEWRHEIHVRRVASPDGDPKSYVACERPRDAGMVNSNAKLHVFRDDPTQYEIFKPAAARQSDPYLVVDDNGTVYVAWDDDRWDDPFRVGSVRNRDIFASRMEATTTGAYISPVIQSRTAEPAWYVLSWWAATGHSTDVLFQTRFGTTPNPPQQDVAANGWTRWTGNPGSTYLGCDSGVGCYYDAPGRHIVGPNGDDWFGDTNPGAYPYMQYKIIMRGKNRWTALSQVIIHYKGPEEIYLPLVLSP